MSSPARLLFPALRWQDDTGFGHEDEKLEQALELGVGGFIIFGGPAAEVTELTRRVTERSPHPLLFGADLERGAGQQFEGATRLPPAAALGSLNDVEVMWRAGRLTAGEARACGVSWVFAPVSDLANEPDNPIVATRSFGSEAHAVGSAVTAWVMGCLEGGALPCVKHFPGHGRTVSDSHAELPVVEADFATLAGDLVPFAAGVKAGVPSVMTAHVAFPALDPSGLPATRSAPILGELLRGSLGFEGVIVSDAMIMEGARGASGEVGAVLEAVMAGVDAVLYVDDTAGVATALEVAAEEPVVRARIEDAALRLAGLRASGARVPYRVGPEEREWARAVARRCVRVPRLGDGPTAPSLVVVDDDVGGPYPAPSREPLVEGLASLGVAETSQRAAGGSRLWVAVFADPRAWKGRAGLSERARVQLEALAPETDLILLFGDPLLRRWLPDGVDVMDAWGGESVMQQAAVAALRPHLGEASL